MNLSSPIVKKMVNNYRDSSVLSNTVNKNYLRRNFGHSKVVDTIEEVEALEVNFKSHSNNDIWYCTSEDKIRSVLENVYVTNNHNDSDIETVKLWPIIINVITSIVSTQCDPRKFINEIFNILQNAGLTSPMIPQFLKEQLECINGNPIKLTIASDWSNFLTNQVDICNFIASSQLLVNRDTDEMELKTISISGFIKPRTSMILQSTNNNILTFVSRIYSNGNNLCQNNSNWCSLKSIETRHKQLKVVSDIILKNSRLLISNKSLISREYELLITMLNKQKQAISDSDILDENLINAMAKLEKDVMLFVVDDVDNNQSMASLGKLWLRWGWIQVQLFGITEPLDPQSQVFWEYKYTKEERELLDKERNLFESFRTNLTGVPSENEISSVLVDHGLEHPIVVGLHQRIDYLNNKLANEFDLNNTSVALRPVNDDKFAELKVCFEKFMRINHDWLNRLAFEDQNDMILTNEMMDRFSVSIWETMNKLLCDVEIRCFPDLIEPLTIGLSRCLAGLGMCKNEIICNKALDRIVDLFLKFPNTNDLNLLKSIVENCGDIINDLEEVVGMQLDDKTRVKLQFKLNQIGLKLLQTLRKNSDTNDVERLKTLSRYHKHILDYFQKIWKHQESERKKRIEMEADIYVKEQDYTEQLSEEERTEIEILLSVCPKFENFQDQMMEISSKNVLEAAIKVRDMRNQMKSANSSLLMTGSDLYEIVVATDSIFNNATSEDIFKSIYKQFYHLTAEFICGNATKNNLDQNRKSMFANNLCVLHWEQNQESTNIDHNLYQDPVIPSEIIVVIPVLHRLKARINSLLSIYPDHMTLLQIRTKLNGLLEVSTERPLIMFIGYVEQIIEVLRSWQIIAAKHVSVQDNLNELESILSIFRHKELQMWRSTLKTASLRQKESTYQDFIKYYDLLIKCLESINEEGFNAVNEMLKPIINDLLNSSMGTLQSRLEIIKLLILSVENLPFETSDIYHLNTVKVLLQNQLDLYSLFAKSVEEQLNLEYDSLDKELKGFIKTKKWGTGPPKMTDVNRCHKTVFKFLRRWNDVMNKKCCEMFILKPNSNLLTLAKKCDEFVTKQPNLLTFSYDLLSDLANYWESMQSLRAENLELEKRAVEDSKLEDKEKAEKRWRGLVKNLQQRKRNCLMGFLKYMQSKGLHKTTDINFDPETALMTHLPNGDVKIDSSTSVVRCLGLRHQIEVHKLQPNEVDKSVDLSKFNDVKDILLKLCDNYLCLTAKNTFHINKLKNDWVNTNSVLTGLKESFGKEFVKSGDALEIDRMLSEWISLARERTKYLTHFTEICEFDNNELISIETLLTVASEKSSSWFISKDCYRKKMNYSKLAFEKINNFIEKLNISLADNSEGPIEKLMEPNLKRKFKKQRENDVSDLYKEIEVFKNLINEHNIKLNGFMFDKNAKDLNFETVLGYVEKLAAALCSSDIMNCLKSIKEFSFRLDIENLNKVINEFGNDNVLLEINKYCDMQEFCLTSLNKYHEVLVVGLDSLLTVTHNLIKDGFCVPDDSAWQDADQEGGASEHMNNFDMAGMDDGEGTNDVSDQITGENQLEGLKDDNKEKKDQEEMDDVKDEENGIEMSEDFEGKMHDPEVDDTQNEDNSGEDDENLNDIEDQMGDVGDAQETDCNKDAWDENDEGEEENEEEKRKDDRNGGIDNNDEKAEGVPDKDDEKEKNKDEQKESCENGDNLETEENDGEFCDDTADNEGLKPEHKEDEENMDVDEKYEDSEENKDTLEGVEEDAEEEDDLWNDDIDLNMEFDNNNGEGEGEDKENEEVEEEMNVDNDANGQEENEDESMDADENPDDTNAAGLDETNTDHQINMESALNQLSDTCDFLDGLNGNDSSSNNGYNDNSCGETRGENEMDANDNKEEEKEESNNNVQNNNKPTENRTLGNKDQPLKRKGEVIEHSENNKRTKTSEVYEHIEEDVDSAEEMMDNALEDQAMACIDEVNDAVDKSINSPDDEIDDKPTEELGPSLSDKVAQEVYEVGKQNNNEYKALEEEAERNEPWSSYMGRSEYLSRQVCEMLRTVLEPTKATKLGGAYRTGKRLNMKKLIPYVASGYRKDKIWMRRNQPSQRQYQVLMAVDNSYSMQKSCSRRLLFESLSVVLNGLSYLEVGRLGIFKFGGTAETIKTLSDDNATSFSTEEGEHMVNMMDFNDGGTYYINALELGIKQFKESKDMAANVPQSQMLLFLSDGSMTEDFENPRLIELIREAHNLGILLLNIILDDGEHKIYDMKLVRLPDLVLERYLDKFPMKYIVLQYVSILPDLLTNLLRQWFEMVSSEDKSP